MDIDLALAELAADPGSPLDVAEVALLLARDEYPGLDVEASLQELSAMAHEASAYVRGDLEARVTGLCRYLFHEMGFRGNVQNYYDPRNSYLNQVLDRRTGIPITLSIMAMAVGSRAGLDVAGIGLPGHFVARASEGSREVLFDPFHGGRLLTPEACEQLAARATGRSIQPNALDWRAVPLGLLVQRMLNNLRSIYLRQEDFVRTTRILGRLRQLDSQDPLLHRDLGLCLLKTGDPGKAIDQFDTYLTAVPQAEDIDAVRQLLQEARGQVAQWN